MKNDSLGPEALDLHSPFEYKLGPGDANVLTLTTSKHIQLLDYNFYRKIIEKNMTKNISLITPPFPICLVYIQREYDLFLMKFGCLSKHNAIRSFNNYLL